MELMDENGKRNDDAYEFLKKVFALRMPFNPIPDNLLEMTLTYSGGVLVDAMRMVRGICLRAILDDGVEITSSVVEEELQHLVDDYQFTLDNRQLWKKLAEVCNAKDTRVLMTDALLPELLYRMIVIEYRGTRLWFDLHPAVRRLYTQYSNIIDEAIRLS